MEKEATKNKKKLVQINMEENFSGYRDLVDEDFDFDKEMCDCGCIDKNDFTPCDCQKKTTNNEAEKKDNNKSKPLNKNNLTKETLAKKEKK